MRTFFFALVMLFVVTAACQAAPRITNPPTIVGQACLGNRLEAPNTLVEQATDADLTFTWERSTNPGAFVEIPDAHDTSYVPVIADAGRRLRVHVVVETAEGRAEAWSPSTAPVTHRSDAVSHRERLQAGGVRGAPVSLQQWVVTAGSAVTISGQVPAGQTEAAASVVLEPTISDRETVTTSLVGDESGRVSGVITPAVNAIAWLVLDSGVEAPQRILLGVVGVRPRIRLSLVARRDGHDGRGRTLIRDLSVRAGSVVAPGVAGLHLSWEGILPGEQRGTAVCRSSERVISTGTGNLRGGCATRGAWLQARWRLVYDPGTSDLGASPFLSAASAWVRPRIGGTHAFHVPNLPRAYATLRPWT